MKTASYVFPSNTRVHEFHAENGTTLGYLVIDSEIDGRSAGGIRMADNITAGELVELARIMTRKFSFVGIDLGGAKGGIVGNPEGNPSTKQNLLERFGQSIGPWLRQGLYIPGVDLGTSSSDIRVVYSSAGIRRSNISTAGYRTAEATAKTIVETIKVSCEVMGMSLANSRAAIEGFGAVGSEVARLLVQHAATIIAVSTSRGAIWNSNGIDITLLGELQRTYGSAGVLHYPAAEFLDSTQLSTVPADLYIPCARMYSISIQNASEVKARLVCGGSNLQATPEAAKILHDRSILYVPPYVANCGGVFWSAMRNFGLPFSDFETAVESTFRAQVRELLLDAARQQRPLFAIADELTAERFALVKSKAEKRSVERQLWKLGRWVNTRGLIPTVLKRIFGQRWKHQLFR